MPTSLNETTLPNVPAGAIRAMLRRFRTKSDAFATWIFAVDALVYLAATAAAIRFHASPWGAAAGALAGLGIAMLFVVGHDACHGSFTSRRRWNAVIGRLAFVPSLTPFSAWDIGHNRTHHVYTNLKSKDYVWAPLSKAEYDDFSWRRRLLERAYRTPPGVGLYYAVEIWWKRLFFPASVSRRRARRFAPQIHCCARRGD